LGVKITRSKQAAHWLVEQTGNVGYMEAGERFKITREAVRQAWQQLGFGETPRESFWKQAHAAIVDLARTEKTSREIEELTGFAPSIIRRLCLKNGIRLRDALAARTADPEAVAAGLEIVRAGGSIGEGTSVAGVQYAAFHRYVKRAKIAVARFDQQKRRFGRSAQAALLVEQEGISPGEAAKLYAVSPISVRAYMRRHAP
jgi:hypothetical protein